MSTSGYSRPRSRASSARGATLLELSLVVTVLALFFAMDLQSRREDRLFSLSDLAAAELNEIIAASLSYRTSTGQWPLDRCATDYLLPASPPSPLSSNCNGDSAGLIDENDLSGVRRLFRAGYIPLSAWRTELSSADALGGGRRALSLNSVLGGQLLLQPVPTTGTASWPAWSLKPTSMSYAAFAAGISTPADLETLTSRQGLRLSMALPAPFACMAHYISGLVPLSRVLIGGLPIAAGTLIRAGSQSCAQIGNVSVEVLRRNAVYTRSEPALLGPSLDPDDIASGSVLRVQRLIIGDNVVLDAPGNRIFFEQENTYSPYYGVLRMAPYDISSTQATTVETAIQFARSSHDIYPSEGLALLAARPGGGPQAEECCVEHYRLSPGDSSSSADGNNFFPYGLAPYSPVDRNWQNNVLIMRTGIHPNLLPDETSAFNVPDRHASRLLEANDPALPEAFTLSLKSLYRDISSSIVAGAREPGQPAGLTYHSANSFSEQVSGIAFATPRDMLDPNSELVIGGVLTGFIFRGTIAPGYGPTQGHRVRSALDLYNDPTVYLGPDGALRAEQSYVNNLFIYDTDLILGYGPRSWPWDPLGYIRAAEPYQTTLGIPSEIGWGDESLGVIALYSDLNLTIQQPTRLLGLEVLDLDQAITVDIRAPLKVGRENSGSATHTLATDAIIEVRRIVGLNCLQCTDSTRCPLDAEAIAC